MRSDSVQRWVIWLAIASVSLQACSSARSTQEVGPAWTESVDGQFSLRFDVVKGVLSPAEAVEGTATLSYTGSGGVEIWSSGGGPLSFGFAEDEGSRAMGPASTADCRHGRLEAGSPIVSAILKSGGFGAEDPNAPFYQSFFADPKVHLPPGNWSITAVAQFSEGSCDGPAHKLEATIWVRVLR